MVGSTVDRKDALVASVLLVVEHADMVTRETQPPCGTLSDFNSDGLGCVCSQTRVYSIQSRNI